MASKAKQTPGTHLAVVKGRSPRKLKVRDEMADATFATRAEKVLSEPEFWETVERIVLNAEHPHWRGTVQWLADRAWGRPRETVAHEGGTTLRIEFADE